VVIRERCYFVAKVNHVSNRDVFAVVPSHDRALGIESEDFQDIRTAAALVDVRTKAPRNGPTATCAESWPPSIRILAEVGGDLARDA